MNDSLLTVQEVLRILRIGRNTLYRRMATDKNFPKKKQFAERGNLYFLQSEIQRYLGVQNELSNKTQI